MLLSTWLRRASCGATVSFLNFASWAAGSGSGFGSLFTPRGHVTSLLGGSLAAEISQRASSLALVAIAVAYALFALRLARGRN